MMDTTQIPGSTRAPDLGGPPEGTRGPRDRERLLTLEKEARAAAEIAVHRISTLQTVTAALSEAVTLAQVVDIIVSEGVPSLGAQRGALFLVSEASKARADREPVELVAHRGVEPELAGRIARLLAHDEQTHACMVSAVEPTWAITPEAIRAIFPPSARWIEEEMTLTALCTVPLAVGGRVAGLLCLGFDTPQTFPEEERAFVIALVGHCAQAVERARLYEAERRSNRRFELVARAAELVSSSIDYETTLANVAASALPALGDYGFLDVVEGDNVRRVNRASGESLAAQLDGARFAAAARLGGGGLGFHPRVDDSVLAAFAPSPEHVPLLRRLGPCSIVCIPLRARQEILGWLTLAFGPSKRHHTPDDLEIAEEIARRAAMAVENAALHRASREATARAQEANRRSELANRTKDEFLGVVSHELRTPLNAVLGWAQLLRGPAANDPATLAKGLRVIDKNARAQAKLIEDILDVSRIITGKLRLELRPIELEGVVRASIEVIRPAADAKGIELSVITEARPAIMGDPDRMQQVVWNLLSNAVKFTPQGGHVTLVIRRDGDQAEIEVRDDGRGIEAELLPFVFDRFRQADASPTRRYGGLGLGLAIVKHLVELHGGAVRADSDGPGNGARFTVRLPARDEEEHEWLTLRDTDPGRRTTTRIDGVRVLVVDDEPDARDLVSTMLSAAGADVRTAASAAEAYALMLELAPHVLVSDVGMPGEDGYALIRRVRSSGPPLARIPAVALTAYAGTDDARRAVLAGFHTHLPKPAEPRVLTAVIASLAGRLNM
ncbi:Chemotaxis protein methyltransferase CheR [Minicystis rosea]|nr:Chemotaxis protein methyltransferase CheR [Minicystis rosea]